jgi:hypothetical protein
LIINRSRANALISRFSLTLHQTYIVKTHAQALRPMTQKEAKKVTLGRRVQPKKKREKLLNDLVQSVAFQSMRGILHFKALSKPINGVIRIHQPKEEWIFSLPCTPDCLRCAF